MTLIPAVEALIVRAFICLFTVHLTMRLTGSSRHHAEIIWARGRCKNSVGVVHTITASLYTFILGCAEHHITREVVTMIGALIYIATVTGNRFKFKVVTMHAALNAFAVCRTEGLWP